MSSVLVSGEFWGAALERAVKTAAQCVGAVIGVGAVTPAEVDWQQALVAGALGALLSVLTSVSSAGVGNPGPSFLGPEQLTTPVAVDPGADPAGGDGD